MNEVYGFAAVIVSIITAQLLGNYQLNGRMDRLEKEVKDTRSEIKDVRTEVISRIDRVQADLTQFARELGRADARLDILERKAS
jgi:hypothetical protein